MKRTNEVDELHERRRVIAGQLAAHRRGDHILTDEARRWLEREQRHYSNGGDLAGWHEKRQRILEVEAATAQAVADEKARADEAQAKAQATADAIDEAIKAKIAYELDPVTQYKRAHATRTF